MQTSTQQNISFRALHAPKDVQEMQAFKRLKPWLLLKASSSDLFIAKNPENPKQFSVTLQSLQGRCPKTDVSKDLSAEALQLSVLTAEARHTDTLGSAKLPPEIETALKKWVNNLFGGNQNTKK